MKQVDDALDLVSAGKLDEAIEKLVIAWRATPNPRIADAIDAIDARLPKASFESWIGRARKRDRADLGALLATLTTGTLKDTKTRIGFLGGFGRDPRVASALFKIVREVPFTSNGSRPTWLAIFAHLGELADPRVALGADAAKAGWGIRANQREWLEPRFDALVAALRDKLPERAYAIDAATEKSLGAIESALASGAPKAKASGGPRSSLGELLAAIYANPSDDGARAVYADALQEAGDPRGELIALQLQRERTKQQIARERALLKAHEREWIGGIAPVVNKGGTEFARGFLVACDVRFKNERDARAYGSLPEWATVERLRHGLPGSPPRDQMKWLTWLDPAMKSLRDVDVFPESLPTICAAKEPWVIEHIHWGAWQNSELDGELGRMFATTEKLPNLRALTFHSSNNIAWLGDARFAPALERLTMLRPFESPDMIATLLDRVAPKLPRLETLSLENYAMALRFTRAASGRLTRARAEVDFRAPWELERALETIPFGTITELEITRHAKASPVSLDRGRMRTLRDAIARHKVEVDLEPFVARG